MAIQWPTIRCPSCGGPAVIDVDVLTGDGVAVCDAYHRCGPDEQRVARECLALGMPEAWARVEATRHRRQFRIVPDAPLFGGAV